MFTDLEKLNLKNVKPTLTLVSYVNDERIIYYDINAVFESMQINDDYVYIADPNDPSDPDFEATPLQTLLDNYYDEMELGTSEKVFVVSFEDYSMYVYLFIKKKSQMVRELITKIHGFSAGK